MDSKQDIVTQPGNHAENTGQEKDNMNTFKITRIMPALILLLVQFPGAGSSFTKAASGVPLPANVTRLKHTIVDPGYVYDEFKKLGIKQPGDTDDDPYWWVINNGGGAQFYDNCGTSSCATGEKEQSLKYARLQLLHDTAPVWDEQNYLAAEISEYRTLYSSQVPGRWLPTSGHPVTISTNVRFSPNYQQNGTDGAVGTAGMWLWNSYPDAQSYAPLYAFGFNWTENGSAGNFSGLQMSVLQNSIPVYSQPINLSLNMAAWHVWLVTWSVNSAGAQSIQWRVDGTLVGQTTLAEPFNALSLTFWNDNQFPTFVEGGDYAVIMHNPASTQNFDIDWVEISQPQ